MSNVGTYDYALIKWSPDNLLGYDDSTAENSVGSWQATLNGAPPVLSVTHVKQGLHSVELAALAAGDVVYTTGAGLNGCSVVPGMTISGYFWAQAVTASRSVHCSIFFSDKYGQPLVTALAGSTVTAGTGAMVQATVTGTVPTDAAYATLKFTGSALAAGDKIDVDQSYITRGADPGIWTPGLGDIFAAYELWRDDGDGFVQFADIATLIVNQYEDLCGRRGINASYKMRTRTTDGAVSTFTNAITITPSANGCKYAFTSNEDPDLTVVYDDLAPRSYDFSDDRVELKLYNRDNEVVFMPLEHHGDVFTIKLFLAGAPQVVPDVPGRGVFQPMVDIARAALSYVCVLDSDGNRWFATLVLGTGTRDQPNDTYTLDVTVREITSRETTPGVDIGTVGGQPPPIIVGGIGTGPITGTPGGGGTVTPGGGGTVTPGGGGTVTPGGTTTTETDDFNRTAGGTPGTPTPVTSFALPSTADALQEKIVQDVKPFFNWCSSNAVKGAITEMGWPDTEAAASWNALGEVFYKYADSSSAPVTYWDGGGKPFGSGYPLSAYSWTGSTWTVSGQASIVEAHEGASRGVNCSEGEWWGGMAIGPDPFAGTAAFSNTNLGTFGTDYTYPDSAYFTFVAGRGIKVVRVPFRWERLQPTLNAALASAEVTRITSMLSAAAAQGVKCILEAHNYAAYYTGGTTGTRTSINSGGIPNSALADFWGRMATAFGANAGVYAFELMNEPISMPATGFASAQKAWENCTQLCVNAIRATTNGAATFILIPGYDFQNANRWATNHPAKWISDTGNNYAYSAHEYFDRLLSGNYSNFTYAQELSNAQSLGYTPVARTATVTPAGGTGGIGSGGNGNVDGLGTTTSGQVWQAGLGTWTIISNQAALSTSAGVVNWATIPTSANGDTQITLPVIADGIGLVFRFQDAQNYWKFTTATAFNTYNLFKVVAGVQTFVTSLAVTPANGDILKVTADAGQITISVNTTHTTSVTDLSMATTGKAAGLFSGGSTTGRFDDLQVNLRAAGGTVTPGTVTPGTVTPGTVTPGTVTPATVTPATVTPGTVTGGTTGGTTWWQTGASPPTGSKKAMTTVTGDVNITTAGTVYDAKNVTGTINVQAANVKITNFQARLVYNFSTGLVCEDGLINGSQSDSSVQYDNYTLRRVECKNSFDGVKCFGNVTMEDCWVHQMCAILSAGCGNRTDCGGTGNTGGGVSHNDGLQMGGGSNVSLLRCRFENTGFNSGIFLDPDSAAISGVTVDSCFLQGGNYGCFMSPSSTNTATGQPQGIIVRNCILGAPAICMPDFAGYSQCNAAGVTWTNNKDEYGNVVGTSAVNTPAAQRYRVNAYSTDGAIH